MNLNKTKATDYLTQLLEIEDLNQLRSKLVELQNNLKDVKSDKIGLLNITHNGDAVNIGSQYIKNELNQILETQTLERSKYYIQRFIKSITQIKTSKVNDLNLNRWKEYNDILTDSLWIMDKRDNSGAHNAGYWGNFIPQIPSQFLRRYTKAGEWVLDPFLGSGTTLIECKRQGRNGIGIDLNSIAVELSKKNISNENNPFNICTEIITADSTEIDYEQILKERNIKSVQFAIIHPPYWDIIKFSENKNDLSNAQDIDIFLEKMEKIIASTYKVLDKGRYCALVIGDKYSSGEWIPLAFYTMQKFLENKFKLKSTIIKNFEETKGKINQKELWRYRALAGGFYIFKHEYIFLFKKE